MCDVKIWNVHTSSEWFFCSCTSCYRELNHIEGKFICNMCNEEVPHPLKK